MIIISKTISYKPGDIFKIKPIFDVHYGSKNCDTKKFTSFLKDSNNKTYFVGGGDLIEAIPVRDKRYRKSNDSTQDEAIIDSQIKKMTKCAKHLMFHSLDIHVLLD